VIKKATWYVNAIITSGTYNSTAEIYLDGDGSGGCERDV
jgi:hypothetical protein